MFRKYESNAGLQLNLVCKARALSVLVPFEKVRTCLHCVFKKKIRFIILVEFIFNQAGTKCCSVVALLRGTES
jgi:hypothetical protein